MTGVKLYGIENVKIDKNLVNSILSLKFYFDIFSLDLDSVIHS